MLKLSEINTQASEVTKATNYKSVQNFVIDTLKASKTKTLNKAQLFDLVSEYTLTNQRDNWFKTDKLYDTFISEMNEVSTQVQIDNFMTNNKQFFSAMNKKVNDLFFNAKHPRSFIKSIKYNTIVNVVDNKVKLNA